MADPARPSPKASDDDKQLFRAFVPDDERVTVRPMFGAVAAFVNGLMFMGLFADQLFVRLDTDDTDELTTAGGGPLEPMPGKPMRGYVTVPNWRADHEDARAWGRKALDYTLTLPPKK